MFRGVIWGCSLQRLRQGRVQVWWKVTFGATLWTRQSVEGAVNSQLIYICASVYVWLFSLMQSVSFVHYCVCVWGRETAFLGLTTSCVFVYVAVKLRSIRRSCICGWSFVCLLIKTGALWSRWFLVFSGGFCVLFCFLWQKIKWEFVVQRISFSLFMTSFLFLSSHAVFFIPTSDFDTSPPIWS